MIARKPALVLAACNALAPSPSSTSSSPPSTRPPLACARQYATLVDDARHHEPDRKDSENTHTHPWPEPLHGRSTPTPYQILDLKHNAVYSKAKYYRLVKLYHPDLTSPHHTALSQKVRMDRYRLIVAAHTILSDPVKRSAYDRFGAGWDGRADAHSPNNHSDSSQAPGGPFSSHNYADPNNPIWNNATWEDWERFYERQREQGGSSSKRPPVYMANSYFLAMIVALAVTGSSLNAQRAKDAGHYVVEQRDLVHDRAAKELRRVRMEAGTMASRQDRIDFFVRQREATLATGSSAGGEWEALREERAGRVLGDGDVCRSEGVSGRDSEEE